MTDFFIFSRLHQLLPGKFRGLEEFCFTPLVPVPSTPVNRP
jgi:hypothetical protein